MRVGPQNIGIFGSHEVSGDVRERERRRCVCLGVSGCVWMCLRVSLCTCVRKEPGSSYTPNIKRAKVDGFCGTHVVVACLSNHQDLHILAQHICTRSGSAELSYRVRSYMLIGMHSFLQDLARLNCKTSCDPKTDPTFRFGSFRYVGG